MPRATFDGFDTYANIAAMLAARANHIVWWRSTSSSIVTPGRNGFGKELSASGNISTGSNSDAAISPENVDPFPPHHTKPIGTFFMGFAQQLVFSNGYGALTLTLTDWGESAIGGNGSGGADFILYGVDGPPADAVDKFVLDFDTAGAVAGGTVVTSLEAITGGTKMHLNKVLLGNVGSSDTLFFSQEADGVQQVHVDLNNATAVVDGPFNATTGCVFSPYVYNYIEIGGQVTQLFVSNNEVEVARLTGSDISGRGVFNGFTFHGGGSNTQGGGILVDDMYINWDPLGPITVSGNSLVLTPAHTGAAVVIDKIQYVPLGSSDTVKLIGVIYADAGGSPGALLATGDEVVGFRFGRLASLTFTPPYSFSGAADYWIGFINNDSIPVQAADKSISSLVTANTYTMGPPVSAPPMDPEDTLNMGGLPDNRFLGDVRVDALGPVP